ncbi:MAG: RES family NAD+ phosphorylase [Pseudodonghicola sp.]
MMPLPPPLGDGALRLWRLDRARHAAVWNSGEGSYLAGGRWNGRGRRVIYGALDPSTAILEVAVHKTFRSLDTEPHVMTSARIAEPGQVHLLDVEALPNRNWLVPGVAGAGQQAFGDALLERHPIVLLPSVVSRQSWNVLLRADRATALLADVTQEAFALDPRLHPAAPGG